MSSANKSLTVRRFSSSEWRTYRDLRLRALAESPEAFGSTYEREAPREDAEWARRIDEASRSPTDLPLLALLDDNPIGLAWGRLEGDKLDAVHVYQVWVAPEGRNRGAGQLLMSTIIDWAREKGARTVELEVTSDNSPATRLYSCLGFVTSGELQSLRPGSPHKEQPMRLEIEQAH